MYFAKTSDLLLLHTVVEVGLFFTNNHGCMRQMRFVSRDFGEG